MQSVAICCNYQCTPAIAICAHQREATLQPASQNVSQTHTCANDLPPSSGVRVSSTCWMSCRSRPLTPPEAERAPQEATVIQLCNVRSRYRRGLAATFDETEHDLNHGLRNLHHLVAFTAAATSALSCSTGDKMENIKTRVPEESTHRGRPLCRRSPAYLPHVPFNHNKLPCRRHWRLF